MSLLNPYLGVLQHLQEQHSAHLNAGLFLRRPEDDDFQYAAGDSGSRQIDARTNHVGLKTTFCRHRLQNLPRYPQTKTLASERSMALCGILSYLASKDLPQLRLAQLALQSKEMII